MVAWQLGPSVVWDEATSNARQCHGNVSFCLKTWHFQNEFHDTPTFLSSFWIHNFIFDISHFHQWNSPSFFMGWGRVGTFNIEDMMLQQSTLAAAKRVVRRMEWGWPSIRSLTDWSVDPKEINGLYTDTFSFKAYSCSPNFKCTMTWSHRRKYVWNIASLLSETTLPSNLLLFLGDMLLPFQHDFLFLDLLWFLWMKSMHLAKKPTRF